MIYDDMSISELKAIRDKKLEEHAVKRAYYYFWHQGIIENKKLDEEYDKTIEKIKDELSALYDLIWRLDVLIEEKENK